MRFRALFIGGPVDGQERILPHGNEHVATRCTPPVVYRRVFVVGQSNTLIYSVYGLEETLNRLWNRYTGENHA